jgi:acyl-CoA thioesterase-1
MQRILLGFLSLALLVAGSCPGRADSGPACDLPDDLILPADPLTHVATALAKRNQVDILALGSGSTVGDSSGAGGGPAMAYKAPRASFPYRMVETLNSMRPADHFELTVEGGRDMTAEAMLPILQRELAAHHYDLVLWQTGTVEAVHGLRPDRLREVLQKGADALANAQADLVLVDPQFSRFMRANVDVNPYETVLQQMTGNPDVTLFRRFDLTQLWIGSGQVDLERTSREQRDGTIALLNTCLGEALARYVLAGTDQH